MQLPQLLAAICDVFVDAHLHPALTLGASAHVADAVLEAPT